MIRNGCLSSLRHRLCNGALGAAALPGIGSIWGREPDGTWRHFHSRCLMWSRFPFGITLAPVARRLSIVEGVAGGEGHDELNSSGLTNEAVADRVAGSFWKSFLSFIAGFVTVVWSAGAFAEPVQFAPPPEHIVVLHGRVSGG